MTNVEFDLQDYLQNMEDRLVVQITAVHTSVKDLTPRVQAVEFQQARVKWLWRMVLALMTAGISQVAFAFFK